MIVLDTTVVSEAMRRDPNPAVLHWLDERDESETALSAMTAAELRAGVAVLPEGLRRVDLHERVETMLTETFHDRDISRPDLRVRGRCQAGIRGHRCRSTP